VGQFALCASTINSTVFILPLAPKLREELFVPSVKVSGVWLISLILTPISEGPISESRVTVLLMVICSASVVKIRRDKAD
jgi:hypothetical protein